MPSQFFGLTIASSALNTFNAAVNTTANNIANVRTEGYSRQQTVRQASQALKINQRYGSAGTGVETTAIKRVRDAYYDVKFWNNNARVGLYDTRLYYSKQVEDYLIDDDSMDGFSTILTNMFNALDSVKNSANNDDARKAFVSKSQNMMDYFNSLSTGYEKIQDSCNQEIANKVANINSIAQEVATLNKQINLQELAGGYANELRDKRDLLVDELSSIVPVEVSETKVSNSNYPETYLGGTDYSLKINGQTLVSSFEYNTLECVAREFKVNQSDIEGLFDVVWSGTNRALVTVGGSASGSLRASFEMRDGNNGEQFNGNVRDAVNDSSGTGAILTLNGVSIKDINDITMNNKGYIMINNKEYEYDSFAYDDTTGNYSFHLTKTLSAEDQSLMKGKRASIGTSVDAMGIPYYMSQMNSFLRSFSQRFNALQRDGINVKGDAAGDFFVAKNNVSAGQITFGNYNPSDKSFSTTDPSSSYYFLTAASIEIEAGITKDAGLFATVSKAAHGNGDVDEYDLVEDMMKLKSEDKFFRGGGAEQFLKCLINDNSVDTQRAEMLYNNYSNLGNTIDNMRLSISGVDEDEEGMDLLRFQNCYNLASKMVQTMTEMYDRLILETGV